MEEAHSSDSVWHSLSSALPTSLLLCEREINVYEFKSLLFGVFVIAGKLNLNYLKGTVPLTLPPTHTHLAILLCVTLCVQVT